MSHCVKCGKIPLPGLTYCATCAVGVSFNPEVLPEYEPPPPRCSEVLVAVCAGRVARLEDEVAALRRQLTALADRTAEVLAEHGHEEQLALAAYRTAVDAALERIDALERDHPRPGAVDAWRPPRS